MKLVLWSLVLVEAADAADSVAAAEAVADSVAAAEAVADSVVVDVVDVADAVEIISL
jgi:hypothetical protein